MSERFALYYAPPAKSPLTQIASKWFQYDAYTGTKVGDDELLASLPIDHPCYESSIKNPSIYGFHATLKPPFRLKENQTKEALIQAICHFCTTAKPVECGKLQVKTIGSFIALGLEESCPKLNQFAQQCVEVLEPFRAELDWQEIQKRNPEKLTKRQRALLDQWGYPFVDDEYRFHLTLTGSLPADQLEVVKKHLQELFFSVHDKDIRVDAIHLFHQENPQSRFKIIQPFPLEN